LKIEITENGTSVYTVQANTNNDGTETFLVPQTLKVNTTYNVKITSVVDVNNFSFSAGFTIAPPTTISDVDGNTYNTVTIGTQTWIKENLKTTKYNDGTNIANVTDNTAWTSLSTPAYCWYNNDAATNKATYGALYNWYAVDAGSNGNKNVCPTGWHVTSNTEWSALFDYLTNNGFGYQGSGNDIAKSISTTIGWTFSAVSGSPGNDPASNNASGLSLPPGGHRLESNGSFLYINSGPYWWTSTSLNSSNVYYMSSSYNGATVGIWDTTKKFGFSVRCIKD